VNPVRGYVFDGYGTLFDVHAVVEAGREITSDPAALSTTWRQKQLEYTWLRALMGAYVDFWAVTEAALRYSIRRLGLAATEAQVRRLMEAYLTLASFPEVKASLARLAGRPRAVLSNGAPAMLAAAVAASGLTNLLEHVISVDRVKTYKPSPLVYALSRRHSGWPPASCSSSPRTAGTSPARRRSATRSPGAIERARPRKSSACAPTWSSTPSRRCRGETGAGPVARIKTKGGSPNASRPNNGRKTREFYFLPASFFRFT
jgi:2-haloacid dehalogenase